MANLKDTIVLGNLTVTGKINGKFEGAEVSVVNNNPTLAWNTTSTVGTISGTAIQITMPANPNTYLGYPAGFNNRPTSITWGTLATGHTYITRWDTSNGGSVAFAQKQDSSLGWQTHMQIDGFFYQNEGANKVLDTSNVSGTANKIAKFTATNTIGSSNISDDNTTITLGKSVVVRCSKGSYNEGIRITPRAAGGWSNVFFSDSITDEGTHEKGWLCGKMDSGNFTIEPGNSNGSGLWLPYTKTNRPKWNNNELAYLSDCKNPTDYYWANVKVSSTSNASTSPTFNTMTATQASTDRISSKTGAGTKIYIGADCDRRYMLYRTVTVGTSWTTIFTAFQTTGWYGACRVFFGSGSGYGGYVDLVHPKSNSALMVADGYQSTEVALQVSGMSLQVKIKSGSQVLYVWGLGIDA